MSVDVQPILLYIPDLLMRQQIATGLQAAGYATVGAASTAKLAGVLESTDPAGVVIELDGVGVDAPAALASLAARGAPVLGFCAHTRLELIDAARAAGATRVVARGELTRRLTRIAGELFGAPRDATAPAP